MGFSGIFFHSFYSLKLSALSATIVSFALHPKVDKLNHEMNVLDQKLIRVLNMLHVAVMCDVSDREGLFSPCLHSQEGE